MGEYDALSERDGVIYDERKHDYSITDRDVTTYANEKKEVDYGSVKSEICAVNIHGEDSQLIMEALEADAEIVKAGASAKNENRELGVSRNHRFGTSHWVSTHLVIFFIGCVLINVWPRPKFDPSQHEGLLRGREGCMRSLKACTMDRSSSNSTCTEKFVVCGNRLVNRNDQCTADYVNCTNWASSLKGEHETEGLSRCKTQMERCEEYYKPSNWKSVAFVIMLLTVIGYMSRSPPVFVSILFIEIVIGIYTDSFRGYALGSFLAGMLLPCVGGVPVPGGTSPAQQRANSQQRAREVAQLRQLMQAYQQGGQA